MKRIGLWLFLAGASLAMQEATTHLGRARLDRRLGTIVLRKLVEPGASRLWPKDSQNALPVAALSLSLGRDREYFYARSGGLWRCAEAEAAPADEQRLVGLINSLLSAQGVLEADSSAESLARYGLERSKSYRIQLHGPAVLKEGSLKDVLFALELSAPAADKSLLRHESTNYARIEGSSEILGLDTDLLALLGDLPSDSLGLSPSTFLRDPKLDRPPLLDPFLIPGAWPGFNAGIRGVRIEQPDGSGFHLRQISAGEPTPENPFAGSFELRVEGRAESIEAHSVQASVYLLFLGRIPYRQILSREDVPDSALNRVRARLIIETQDGPTLELLVLEETLLGAHPVINGFSQNAYDLDPQVIELLLPTIDQLTDPKSGLVWDEFLKQ